MVGGVSRLPSGLPFDRPARRRPDRLGSLDRGPDEIDPVVVSDAQQILGIGDWGINGTDISIGKLAVYTAAAGIDPDRVLAVNLDVGTDARTASEVGAWAGGEIGLLTAVEQIQAHDPDRHLRRLPQRSLGKSCRPWPTASTGASLLPDVGNLRASSAAVAVAVACAAAEDGVATRTHDNPIQAVQDAMWQPVYADAP